MEVHESARKHGISDADMLRAAQEPVHAVDIGEDPHRQLRLGFSHSGLMLETVVLTSDDGRQLVIHAMKARRQYIAVLEEQGW